VLSGSSLGQQCGATQGQNCTADAPFCVPKVRPPDAGPTQTGGADGGADAGPTDGGTGELDGGSADAGPADAGPVEAVDAGFICAPYCTNGTSPCPAQLSCDTSVGDPNIYVCH
jgi:hypothetical protein